jgi:predicted DNA-binding ribbon-helix-helix protein
MLYWPSPVTALKFACQRRHSPTETALTDNIIHLDLADDNEEGASASREGELLEWAAPEFRAVTTSGGRKGLRLERAFWSALTTIASWSGAKRHKLIAKVLDEADGQALNSSSALRSFAMNAMHKELERVRAQSDAAFAVPLLQQAPVPSFAVDKAKRIIRVNGEFNHFLRILFAESGDLASKKLLQLNLETPVAQVFADLGGSGRAGQYMLNISVEGRSRRTRTRIVAVPPYDPRILVGYIIP